MSNFNAEKYIKMMRSLIITDADALGSKKPGIPRVLNKKKIEHKEDSCPSFSCDIDIDF